MRAERMIATLLLMQARGRVTAAELATELEVSVATARRDLQALSTAGVPVYPQPGRGGGWSLVGGARTNLSGLTAPEAQELFVLLGQASTTPEARSAVRKLLRALPGPFQADAEAAAAAVRVDESGWGEPTRERPGEVDVVQQAIIDRRQVDLDYADRAGRRGTVRLSPLGLIDKDDTWYLLAVPEDRPGGGVRTYRLDRVAALGVTEEPARRPAGFDLAAEWRRVVSYVEGRRGAAAATVAVEPRHVEILRAHFGRYFDVLDEGADRVTVSVAAHTPRAVAEQLAGWGAAVEVLEPADVRAELARIGAELSARYGPPG